jgi:predicted HAD superfamily Cof-like phosphohydrolase
VPTYDALDIPGRLFNTNLWFKRAVPKPTSKNFHTQVGCHLEEVLEMVNALSTDDPYTASLLSRAEVALEHLSKLLKSGDQLVYVKPDEEAEFLDALCDQLVTATGIGHMKGYKILEALDEVNRSNWSKFVGGVPVFDANQKIQKGPDYFKADLSKFLPNTDD